MKRLRNLALRFRSCSNGRRADMSQDDGFIYLIWAQGTDRVKIGFSDDPSERLRSLQTGSPFPLHLLAQSPAPRYMEARVHQALAEYHRGGEWFESFTDIVKVIWDVISGRVVLARVSQGNHPLPFPALRHPEGPGYYEVRESKSGDIKVRYRWRSAEKNAAGARIKKSLLCGRWSSQARQ